MTGSLIFDPFPSTSIYKSLVFYISNRTTIDLSFKAFLSCNLIRLDSFLSSIFCRSLWLFSQEEMMFLLILRFTCLTDCKSLFNNAYAAAYYALNWTLINLLVISLPSSPTYIVDYLPWGSIWTMFVIGRY